jgi:hypothetical protein
MPLTHCYVTKIINVAKMLALGRAPSPHTLHGRRKRNGPGTIAGSPARLIRRPHIYRVNLMVTIKELCYNLTGLGGGRSSRGQAAALKAALGIENL